MKTRILSLLMAVCMLVALVPALAISVLAEDEAAEGFTTAYDTSSPNWPTWEGKVFTGFHGNWTMGHYDAGVYFGMTDDTYVLYYGSDFDVIISYAGGHWGYTGLYLPSGRAILTTSPYYGQGSSNKCAFAMNYKAQYQGTVDISFTTLAPSPKGMNPALEEGVTPYMYVAVLVNDTMIWPTANGDITKPEDMQKITDTEDLENLPKADMLKDVALNIGDNVRFVVAHGNTWYGTMLPSITYDPGYESIPTHLLSDFAPYKDTWPEARNLKGVSSLKQMDTAWTMGTFAEAGKTFSKHVFQQRGDAITTWTGTDREHLDYAKNSGIVLNAENTIKGAYYFGAEDTAAGLYPAYQLKATATGKANITVGGSLVMTDVDYEMAMATGTATVDVYKGTTKLGTITIAKTAAGTAATATGIENVDVVKGDIITFVGKGGNGKMENGTESVIKTLTALPRVNYTRLDSFIAETTAEKYATRIEDPIIVVDRTIGISVRAYATRQTYVDAESAVLYVWDKDVADKTVENATSKVDMTVDDSFAWSATYTGFAAKEMTDDITSMVVITLKDGTELKSESTTFQVSAIAQNQFNTAVEEDDRRLMAAVLNYGAYAQKFFKYNTDRLANAALDPSYAVVDPDKDQYFARFDGEAVGNLISASEIEAISICLDGTLSLRTQIRMDTYEKENSSSIVMTYATSRENLLDVKSRKEAPVDYQGGYALIPGFDFKTLDEVVWLRLAVKVGRNTYYGYAYSYSVESYAARMIDSTEPNLPELLAAMMTIGKLVNPEN